MIINCPKCRRMSDIKLIASTDEVVCTSCKAVLHNMTIFVKNSLRANKDFLKASEGKHPYSVKCNHCGREVLPLGENLLCPECGKAITVSKFFANAIKNK